MRRFRSLTLAVLLALAAQGHGQKITPEILKSVELEWDQVETVLSYEVRLTPALGGTARVFTAKENHLTQDVPIGTYTLQVRCLGKDGETFSPWSEGRTLEVANKEVIPISPEDKSTIDAENATKQPVQFKWSPVDKVKIYTLKVWSTDKKDTPWVFTGTDTSKKLAVPPGKVYFWQVSFESAGDTDYAQEPKVFSFTLQGSKLLKPEITRAGPTLNWDANPEASHFLAKFYYRHLDETEWTLVREETLPASSWPIAKLKPGSYKLEVTATAPRHLSSDPAAFEFTVKPSLVELTQARADKP
jgi:hypothetical protein